VERNPTESLALFTRAYDVSKIACRRGDAGACLLAGELLDQGRAAPEGEDDALAFFKRACEGGQARGCAYADTAR
jgi:TPR repeat protein